jgi:hypothetical protein
MSTPFAVQDPIPLREGGQRDARSKAERPDLARGGLGDEGLPALDHALEGRGIDAGPTGGRTLVELPPGPSCTNSSTAVRRFGSGNARERIVDYDADA